MPMLLRHIGGGATVLGRQIFAASQNQPQAVKANFSVQTQVNGTTNPRWDAFEITFRHPNTYAYPFQDITVDVVFTSPHGQQVTLGASCTALRRSLRSVFLHRTKAGGEKQRMFTRAGPGEGRLCCERSE